MVKMVKASIEESKLLEQSRRSSYDDEFLGAVFSGDAYKLTRGTHFTCTVDSLKATLYQRASKLGKRLSIKIVDPQTVLVQCTSK